MKSRLLIFLLCLPWRICTGQDVIVHAVPWPEQAVELRALRIVLRGNPQNISLAVHVANRLVEKARREGTPQPLSHAMAALAPWWDQPDPHPEVLLLRATIRQCLHEFPAALADLDALVKARPADAQAWLTRATVQLVSGDLKASGDSCLRLKTLASPVVFAAAQTAAESLQRDTPAAVDLARLLSEKPAESPAVLSWASAILADHLARWGHPQQADEWFREALSLTPDDRSLLAARADFLIAQGLAGDAQALLESHTSDDLLLLRLALAARARHDPAAVYINLLKDHAATARALDVSLHLREDAMLHLLLADDPNGALPMAMTNWLSQREAADARLLLNAAAAAGKPEAARPVLEWMEAQKIGAPDLVKAAASLKSPISTAR